MRAPALAGFCGSMTIVIAMAAHVVRGQDLDHGMTPADLERGGQLFLMTCAGCHGQNGDAIAGTDLATGAFRRASTDQELATLIRSGIPGTPMPPNTLSEADAARVVAYLRSMPAKRLTSSGPTLVGDASRGRAIFDGRGRCRECHLVDGDGGFLGPDLSSVGITRRVDDLELKLADPGASIRTGNRAAIVTKRDGTRVTGRLLNQDTYSLQLIDARGHLMSVMKQDVTAWEIPAGSVMPGYRDTLSAAERADVVSYLLTLRAPVPAFGGRGGFGGPRAGGPGPGQAGPAPAPVPGSGATRGRQ